MQQKAKKNIYIKNPKYLYVFILNLSKNQKLIKHILLD